MYWHEIFKLFTKYEWIKRGEYRWQIIYDKEVVTAHIGGPSNDDLWISFSTKYINLPLVIRDKETLEIYLAPI